MTMRFQKPSDSVFKQRTQKFVINFISIYWGIWGWLYDHLIPYHPSGPLWHRAVNIGSGLSSTVTVFDLNVSSMWICIMCPFYKPFSVFYLVNTFVYLQNSLTHNKYWTMRLSNQLGPRHWLFALEGRLRPVPMKKWDNKSNCFS